MTKELLVTFVAYVLGFWVGKASENEFQFKPMTKEAKDWMDKVHREKGYPPVRTIRDDE